MVWVKSLVGTMCSFLKVIDLITVLLGIVKSDYLSCESFKFTLEGKIFYVSFSVSPPSHTHAHIIREGRKMLANLIQNLQR